MPHLNFRGVVKTASGDNYNIDMSESFKKYFKNEFIEVYAPNSRIKLLKNDDVFIKFKKLKLDGNKLYFDNIEIYKYAGDSIEKKNAHKVLWWSVNDFGGFLKTTGTEFEYNGYKYVDADENYAEEDGKTYFIDVYDGQLLIEEYKNIFPPMKWYNMVNPQESYFDILVKIYNNKNWGLSNE